MRRPSPTYLRKLRITDPPPTEPRRLSLNEDRTSGLRAPTADFSVVDPYRMMREDSRCHERVTRPVVPAWRTWVNINATRYRWKEIVPGLVRMRTVTSVQQLCSNLSETAEMLGKALTQKYDCLQEFCELQKSPANYRAAFTRQRSLVRAQHRPHSEIRALQVKGVDTINTSESVASSGQQ